VLPGVIGTLQATEALKLLLGLGESLAGRLLSYDALTMRFEEFRVKRDPDCPVCGTHPTITELIDYEQFCGVSPAAPAKEMSVGEYEVWRHTHDHLLVDVREPAEYQSGNMGGVLIPLRELESRMEELPHDRTIVVHCKSGKRSAWAQILLWQHQFKDVVNLQGGYDAWLAKK
jgi:adenylyltransferase/sulfurtransferase